MSDVRWFYNGTKMLDGTPKSVGARNELEVADCIKKGYVEVGGDAEKVVEPKSKTAKIVKKSNKKNVVKSKKD